MEKFPNSDGSSKYEQAIAEWRQLRFKPLDQRTPNDLAKLIAFSKFINNIFLNMKLNKLQQFKDQL